MSAQVGFSSTNLKELMKKCQENLYKLARNYKRATQDDSEVEKLVHERDLAIQKLSREYEGKIQAARGNSPQIQQIRQEVIRQIKSFDGFKETLVLIGFPDASRSTLKIPAELKGLLNEAVAEGKKVHSEVARLPLEDFRPYRTIEASIKEMFQEIGNEPMKPRQIIEYLVKQKQVPQAEASIRTQLHSLKNESKVSYDGNKKTYQWNFSEAEKQNPVQRA